LARRGRHRQARRVRAERAYVRGDRLPTRQRVRVQHRERALARHERGVVDDPDLEARALAESLRESLVHPPNREHAHAVVLEHRGGRADDREPAGKTWHPYAARGDGQAELHATCETRQALRHAACETRQVAFHATCEIRQAELHAACEIREAELHAGWRGVRTARRRRAPKASTIDLTINVTRASSINTEATANAPT